MNVGTCMCAYKTCKTWNAYVLQDVEGEHTWYMQRGKMMRLRYFSVMFYFINFCITWAEYICLRLAFFVIQFVCYWGLLI